MERRMLLAVVLSFLAVTAYSLLTQRGCMAPRKPTTPPAPATGETPATEPGTPAPGGQPGPDAPGPAAPAPGPAPDGGGLPLAGPSQEELAQHPQAGAPALRVELESEELRVAFTSQGGAIESITLKHAHEVGTGRELDIVLPADPHMLMGQTDDTHLIPSDAPGGPERSNEPAGAQRLLHWTRDSALEAATPEDDVAFTFATPSGLTYGKRWWLAKGAGRYDLKLELWAAQESTPNPERAFVDLKLLAASGQIREQVEGAFANPSGVIQRVSRSKDISDTLMFGSPVEEIDIEGVYPTRLRTLGTRSAYFMAVLFTAPNDPEVDVIRFWSTGEQASLRGRYERALQTWFQTREERDLAKHEQLRNRVQAAIAQMNHAWAVVRLPLTGPQAPARFSFYVGPVDRATIRASDVYDELRPVLTYPNAADWVGDILLWIYDFWRNLLSSAGMAIILMTMVVRGGLMPLSVRNQLSMRAYGRKISKLKPKVKALQEKFASNPRRLREEQMKLYREHGVGFPSGCLMMLIQIPIFFALFSCLRMEYTIRGASFLWIEDLSGPDKLIDFGTKLFDVGILYVDSLNILPLLMVGLSIWHTRQMPPPADEQQAQQQKMMKWLPVIFAVILYNYTAALSLYMVLSSAVAILESRIVKGRDAASEAAAA